jgi:hypothetical protein
MQPAAKFPKPVLFAAVYTRSRLSDNVYPPNDMDPKLINGKVWVPDSELGGYRQLPENDPKYMEILLWIDSQRFVELLSWIYNREKPRRK